MEGRKAIRQRNKGRRVKECKGVKDRLNIYYNLLINNVLDGGAFEGLYWCSYPVVQKRTHCGDDLPPRELNRIFVIKNEN